MIQAVFLDWFYTLANYDPPREIIHSQALKEFDITLSPEEITPGLLIADRDFYNANAVRPLRERSPIELREFWTNYETTIVTKAGINLPELEIMAKVIQRAHELSVGLGFGLFDDVLPNLKKLKERKLTIGLLTNLNKDIDATLEQLGLKTYLDFAVTSSDVGADKPHPPIFLEAMKKSGISAANTVHVGDQYNLDVIGARGVGIQPVLIDRFGMYPDVTDCPCITSLDGLYSYL